MWYTSSTWTSIAFDAFQKSRNSIAHLSENLKIPVNLLLKHSVIDNSAESELSKMVLQAPAARLSVLKDRPLRLLFRVGNSQKSQDARSGLYGEWEITSNHKALFFSHRSDVLHDWLHYSSFHSKQTNNTKCNLRYLTSLSRDLFEIFFTYWRDLLLHNHDVVSPKISVVASAACEYSFRKTSFIAFEKHTSCTRPIRARVFIFATFM